MINTHILFQESQEEDRSAERYDNCVLSTVDTILEEEHGGTREPRLFQGVLNPLDTRMDLLERNTFINKSCC